MLYTIIYMVGVFDLIFDIIAGIDLKLAHDRMELNWNIFDSYRLG